MNIVCNCSGIVDLLRPSQGVSDLQNARFEQVMIQIEFQRAADAGCDALSCYDYLQKNYGPLFKKCASESIDIAALRLNSQRNSLCPTRHGDLVELAANSISLCKEIACRCLILNTDDASGRRYGLDCDAYLRLAELARNADVQILFENQYKDHNGNLIRGSFSESYSAADFIDNLNEMAGFACFGFCVNVGTCTLCGQNIQDYVTCLGSRVKAVILRDCDGMRDASLLPFTAALGRQSLTDWLSLIRGLRESEFDGDLILDLEDTAGAFSPMLRPPLLTLAKATADYLIWQIGIESILKSNSPIVLFGAGNMCRNFMKCYGGKYKPIFTCDNNTELWGTEFCGIPVKSPEALKMIPADCVIILCNIYYREIEKQIRNMGVSNAIKYFSDEFMPSFYFNRLKREA